jgi:3-hydroxyacyl-CoA dehydrogenase/quercetin dioxygenase-like cupin family protein
LFAAHGREVRLYDVDMARAESAVGRALEMGGFLVEKRLADARAFATGSRLLRVASSLEEAVLDAEHVQECVAEVLEVKQSVFAEADAVASKDAVIATSSSGLSITDIQSGLPGAARCIAAHPYNPPHLVPLVELAPGAETAPEVMEEARRFYLSVGKDPVVLSRDVPGYLANRMSAALWREAIELVRSGVASVADVDRAISSGPGLRWAVMGPHLLYHLGGGGGGMRGHLEHLGHVKEGMLRDIATWTTFPPDTVDVLEAGLKDVLETRSSGDLERERDEALAGFVAVRSEADRSTAPRPVVVSGTGAVAIEVVPGVTRTTLASGERSTMVRFDLEAGAEIPLHAHAHEQTGVLLSGDLALFGEQGEWAVAPGDSWSVPGGLPHGARTTTGAVAVEAFSPVRVDYLP